MRRGGRSGRSERVGKQNKRESGQLGWSLRRSVPGTPVEVEQLGDSYWTRRGNECCPLAALGKHLHDGRRRHTKEPRDDSPNGHRGAFATQLAAPNSILLYTHFFSGMLLLLRPNLFFIFCLFSLFFFLFFWCSLSFC